MGDTPAGGKITVIGNTSINSTGSSIEDVVNRLMLYGVSRGVLLGELLRVSRTLLGNVSTLVIDEDDKGEVNGVVLANPAVIEHLAEFCTENGWAHTPMYTNPDESISH